MATPLAGSKMCSRLGSMRSDTGAPCVRSISFGVRATCRLCDTPSVTRAARAGWIPPLRRTNERGSVSTLQSLVRLANGARMRLIRARASAGQTQTKAREAAGPGHREPLLAWWPSSRVVRRRKQTRVPGSDADVGTYRRHAARWMSAPSSPDGSSEVSGWRTCRLARGRRRPIARESRGGRSSGRRSRSSP